MKNNTNKAHRLHSLLIPAAALGTLLAPPAGAVEALLAADTYVSSSQSATNFGNAETLPVGNGNRALLRFGLASMLPAGTTAGQVAKAVLNVWVSGVTQAGSVAVSEVLGSLTEPGVTHANLPSVGPAFATKAVSAAGRWVPIVVTSQVKKWLSTPSANNGLLIAPAASGTGTSNVVMALDSKENTATSHPVRLEIELAGTLGGSYTLIVGKATADNTGRTQLSVPDFTTITAALNKIPDNLYSNGVCSARYLIRVLPEVYNERVTMKPCVDIEGSGELTTRITAAGGATLDAASATVVGAKEAELRFLTVENTGGAANAIGIYNNSDSLLFSASLHLTHVTAIASGGSAYNFGVENYHVFYASPSMAHVTATASGGSYSYGVYNEYSSPDMINVTATGSGGSAYNIGVINYFNSSPAMTNVTARTNDTGSSGTNSIGVDNQDYSAPVMTNISAFAWGSTHNYGVRNYNSQCPKNPQLIRMINVTTIGSGSGSGVDSFGVLNYNCKSSIERSTLRGGTNSLYNSAGIIQVGASQLEGGVRYSPTAPLKCVASYDSDFTPLDGSCVYP